jgi:hypothetical protein
MGRHQQWGPRDGFGPGRQAPNRQFPQFPRQRPNQQPPQPAQPSPAGPTPQPTQS